MHCRREITSLHACDALEMWIAWHLIYISQKIEPPLWGTVSKSVAAEAWVTHGRWLSPAAQLQRRITACPAWACRCGSWVLAQAPASAPGISSSCRFSAATAHLHRSPERYRVSVERTEPKPLPRPRDYQKTHAIKEIKQSTLIKITPNINIFNIC